jgi:LPPG:FO 2-phospho-L-lactate transferase
MKTIGQPATSLGVAGAYRGLIDGIVIATEDSDQAGPIEELGIRVLCTNTVMGNDRDKERLARETISFARGLR